MNYDPLVASLPLYSNIINMEIRAVNVCCSIYTELRWVTRYYNVCCKIRLLWNWDGYDFNDIGVCPSANCTEGGKGRKENKRKARIEVKGHWDISLSTSPFVSSHIPLHPYSLLNKWTSLSLSLSSLSPSLCVLFIWKCTEDEMDDRL